MCQFGDESKILNEQELTREQALVGYRNWNISDSFNNKEKFLKSMNREFLWIKRKTVEGNPLKNNSEGIYNYDYNYDSYNYNNYNYYDYNYDNYNYNNYNYYYDYYNNNYNYNNYNYYYISGKTLYYNNYNISGKTLLFGKIFSYKGGYRSSLCIPTHLTILSDEKWFKDIKTKKFARHFNTTVKNLAKEYDCEVIDYDEFIKEK